MIHPIIYQPKPKANFHQEEKNVILDGTSMSVDYSGQVEGAGSSSLPVAAHASPFTYLIARHYGRGSFRRGLTVTGLFQITKSGGPNTIDQKSTAQHPNMICSEPVNYGVESLLDIAVPMFLER